MGNLEYVHWYLSLVDEEDDVGDGVDRHVDAQLDRPDVTDPGPDTQTNFRGRNQENQTLRNTDGGTHTNKLGSLCKNG